jgi:CBS domain-containing protein
VTGASGAPVPGTGEILPDILYDEKNWEQTSREASDMNARQIMNSSFHALHPATPIGEALQVFQRASVESGRRIFGLMVIDDDEHLVGILSMYDILTLLQPKHIHIWGEMTDLDISGLIETMCRKSRDHVVGDIMTTEIITVGADAHLFAVLELMNKHHIRRLPVIEGDRVVGIVYLSDLFFSLIRQIHDETG